MNREFMRGDLIRLSNESITTWGISPDCAMLKDRKLIIHGVAKFSFGVRYLLADYRTDLVLPWSFKEEHLVLLQEVGSYRHKKDEATFEDYWPFLEHRFLDLTCTNRNGDEVFVKYVDRARVICVTTLPADGGVPVRVCFKNYDAKTQREWENYMEYIDDWRQTHNSVQFHGMSPASFDEWRDNENAEEEDEDER